MKKIYSFLLFLFILNVGVAQTKSAVSSGYIYNNEIVFSNQKSAKAVNNLYWSNDFSVVADWIISNSLGNGQNWVITTNSPAGTYSFPMGIIPSTTAANGFALYDSDYMGSSGGSQDASIYTSSSIDLSMGSNLELSFQQLYRRYQSEHCYVGVSTNGTTWTDIEVNASVPYLSTVSNTVIVDISALADNEPAVWIRFHYVGSWEYAWMVDDVEINGTSANAPEIILVNPDNAEQGESLSVAISGQYTHFTQGSETVWFEQASQTIMTGTNVTVQSPSQLSINLSVPFNAPTGMYDVKIENPTDGIVSKWGGFEVLPPTLSPGWVYTNTGVNHSILIPNFAAITISGAPIEVGDYIGVFYDDNGTFECGGFMVYTGLTSFLAAWGDDAGTSDKDGFANGEEFTFMVWDASDGLDYSATATYEITGFSNTAFYVTNGLSGISSLVAYSQQTQTLTLNQGWGIFSTYVIPSDPDIESVFLPVFNSITIIKNGAGLVYWPPFVDMINDMVIGEGYQVNMANATTLDITGIAVTPELTPVSVPLGWSIIGYLRQSPASIITMLSPVIANIIIVKDSQGAVYWPYWGVNGIGNMIPGKGYQINTNSPITITYPANSPSQKSIGFHSEYAPVEYEKVTPTGNNMTLAIPGSAWPSLPAIGDEVGIFTTDGKLVGSAVYGGGNMAIAIWGDDRYTFYQKEGMLPNEEFEIRLFDHASTQEICYQVSSWFEGNQYYKNDGLAVAGQLAQTMRTELFQNTPNPCQSGTEISFFLSGETYISLQVFNALGEFIEEIVSGHFDAGEHKSHLNTSHYPSGNYFYTLKADNNKFSKNFKVI